MLPIACEDVKSFRLMLDSYWYRLMFDEHFPPHCASTVKRWIPKWSKQTDPSGR
jgi:hypothetical protein